MDLQSSARKRGRKAKGGNCLTTYHSLQHEGQPAQQEQAVTSTKGREQPTGITVGVPSIQSFLQAAASGTQGECLCAIVLIGVRLILCCSFFVTLLPKEPCLAVCSEPWTDVCLMCYALDIRPSMTALLSMRCSYTAGLTPKSLCVFQVIEACQARTHSLTLLQGIYPAPFMHRKPATQFLAPRCSLLS